MHCGKIWKRWEYQTTWPASWETYMQVRKQQLELDMEQQTGSKSACLLTSMQSTSWETLGWKKHKLESRLLGEISITSGMQWHHPYGRKWRGTKKPGCETWTIKKAVLKNWCFWTVVLEKTLESPLDSKEIKPVNPKWNQPWIVIGRTDAEAEAPILWPHDMKSWLIGKDPDAGKDWGQEKGWQRLKWLDGIIDSMDMHLNKL